MGLGGIQKSLVNLLRSLDYSKLSVDLYLFSHDDFFNVQIPQSVTVRYLEPVRKMYKYIPFDMAMSRMMGKLLDGIPEDVYYDVSIDFNSYQPECAAGAIIVPSDRRVEWVHNDISVKLENEWKYRVLHFFFKGKYKYFDKFVCVSDGLEESFKVNAGELSDGADFAVIQNMIDVNEIREKSQAQVDDIVFDEKYFNFVTVGRLCHQKGYDIMLECFKSAFEKRNDMRLYLIGDGPDGEKLQNMAESLGIDKNVFFLGRKQNPFSYMNKADAFISTSRYEGQPVNIMEAKAIGLPLYCSKNLEKYIEGLKGFEDVAEALVNAKKEEKHPDNLKEYNSEILSRFEAL